jgi:hypothetical protein
LFSDIDTVENLIRSDGGLTLLSKRNAAFIISFLSGTFKEYNEGTSSAIEQTHLVQLLASYITANKESRQYIDDGEQPEEGTLDWDNQAKALAMIKSWSSPENNFIFRYYDDMQHEMVELSAGTERLLRYLDEVQDSKKLFVGTESRFAQILTMFQQLDENTIVNPKARIDELERKKQQIDRQIKEIEETGQATTYTQLQVAERLHDLERLSQGLLADFRQLKDNNHLIFSELCHRQLKPTEDRGTLLGYIIDSTEALENSPQGQSFTGFWNYLSAMSSGDSLASKATLIRERMPEQKINMDFFSHLEESLYQAGKSILEENHLLSERLKKVITRKNTPDYQLIASLIRQIKTLAVDPKVQLPKSSEPFLSMDDKVYLNGNMARPPILPPLKSEATDEYLIVDPPKIDLAELVADIHIDEEELLNILEEERKKATREGRGLTIQDILTRHPLRYGFAELITYLAILFKVPWCQVHDDEQDSICYENEEGQHIRLHIPKVEILT